MKDVGFGMTVQDRNAPDLVPLYGFLTEQGWSLPRPLFTTVFISLRRKISYMTVPCNILLVEAEG